MIELPIKKPQSDRCKEAFVEVVKSVTSFVQDAVPTARFYEKGCTLTPHCAMRWYGSGLWP